MCRTVLAVKQVCQHGHICEVEACWRHCFFPLQILARSQAPRDNKRLCVDKQNKTITNDFKLISSSARQMFARPYKDNCRTCLCIEETFAPSWAEERANVADRANVVTGLENQLLEIKKQHRQAVREANQGASRGLKKFGDHIATEIQEAKGRLNKSVSALEQKKLNTNTVMVVNQVYSEMTENAIARFDVRTNRRQFIGAFKFDESSSGSFVPGRFDESLIVTL